MDENVELDNLDGSLIDNEQQPNFDETSFIDDDPNDQYNTNYNHLNTPDFTNNMRRRYTVPPNSENLAEEINIANINSKFTEFLTKNDYSMNESTLNQLIKAERIKIVDGKKYYVTESGVEIKISQDRDNTKLYSENTLRQKKYGTGDISEFYDLLTKSSTEHVIPNSPENKIDKQQQTEYILPNGLLDATNEELEQLDIFSNQALREILGYRSESVRLAEQLSIRDYKIRLLEDLLSKTTKEIEQLKLNVDNKVLEETEYKKENAYLEKRTDDLEKEIEFQKQERKLLQRSYDSNHTRLKNVFKDLLIKPDSKISLKDRIKLLFKLEGLTIGTILTVIVMVFTTIGLGISNSIKPNITPTPDKPIGPPDDDSIENKIKHGLQKLAEYLKELAKKSMYAIPGIIGSIISYILKAGGNVLMFAAEHIKLFLIAVVSTVVYGLINMIKTKK